MKSKPAIQFILILLAVIILFIFSFIRLIQQQHIDSNKKLPMLGDLKFKGKVIGEKIYDYGGRPYRLVCLKLDSCNKKDFYLFNELCAIKIKNSIATMSVGGYDSNFPVDYVEMDAKGTKQMSYHYPNGETKTDDIDLGRNGLVEKDMDFCN